MKPKMENKRDTNIELLRIVLMLMIISHHVIVHGFGLKNITSPNYNINNSTYIEILLNSFFVIGVNGFVFISGYFGIKFNLRKIISIVIQAISYSVLFYLAFCLINNEDYDIISLLKSFLPISRNVWWFITTYIGLYFMAPFLNAGIKNIAKKELVYILIGLFILNCFSSYIFSGISKNKYDLFNFIFIYLTGRFLKQNNLTIKHSGYTLLICTATIAILAVGLTYINKQHLSWHIFYYNNPILILSAISLFFIFLKLKIGHSKYINNIAQLTLGVYMIHDYPSIRYYISSFVQYLNTSYKPILLLMILMALVLSIFMVSSFIEFLRLSLYNSIYNRLNNSIKINTLKSKTISFANRQHNKWLGA